VPEEEPDWQEADGIGIVTGAERWYALVLPSFHVQPVVEGLGIENTNWIAQNGQVVTIYFRTDASRGTLRALSLALDEAVDPKVLPAVGVECYGPPIWSVAVPVPPSGKLTYGEWEFWRDAPEEPPPFRSFQVQAKSLAGSHVQKSNEHGDESKVSMELGTSSHVAGREVEAEAGQPGSNLPL
jgi:hypothetical protein